MWLISGYKNIQFWQLHSAVACRWVDQSDNITPAIWRIVTHSHDVPENQKSWVDKGTNGLNFSWFECGGDTVVCFLGWLPCLPSSHVSGGPDDGRTESEWQRAPCSLGFVLSLSVTHFNIFFKCYPTRYHLQAGKARLVIHTMSRWQRQNHRYTVTRGARCEN
jgi:hypothetical protein